jgi:histone chaperone ASF1
LSTGPIPVGTHEFILESDGPDPNIIPPAEIVGVTVVLITCSYKEQEFVRIGYYINNEYESEELRENPPDTPQIPQLRRLVCLNPRVTRMQINWDGKDENTPQPHPQIQSQPTPFGFEFSNSSSIADCNQDSHPLASMTHLERCFQGKSGLDGSGDGPSRPPVFVENSMDCHNIQMSID